jgi:membrane associated rhomboid family serine protease
MISTSIPSLDLAHETDAWVTVRRFSSLNEANDHGLVALAMGEDCRVEQQEEDQGFVLQIERELTPKLEKELNAFTAELEDCRRQTKVPEVPLHPAGWAWYAAWAMGLIAVYRWQMQPGHSDSLFLSSSHGLIVSHQWWRPFTSLFLHADLSHLAGNLLTGLGFSLFVARTFGAWKAWTLILLCGALANALNAWLHFPAEFHSLGASTAVFSALGLLSGSGLVESWRMRPVWTWPKVIAPLLAGIVLLGMLGGGKDPHTDVIGHVCGFVVGLGAGTIVAHVEQRRIH